MVTYASSFTNNNLLALYGLFFEARLAEVTHDLSLILLKQILKSI